MEETSTAREIELVVRGGRIINPDSASRGAVGVNDGESTIYSMARREEASRTLVSHLSFGSKSSILL